jgi:5-methylcytosine-specific restriction endonuclease McrA
MQQTSCSLPRLDDHALRERFTVLVANDHETTAELLRCIDEIDRRKLWAEDACGSLFAWCVKFYHMSESMVSKRIRAARTARAYPVVFEMVERGELHLTGITQLAAHLTDENHRAVLTRAKHLTMREIEHLVAELAPKPDVASRIVKLPRRAAPIEGNRESTQSVDSQLETNTLSAASEPDKRLPNESWGLQLSSRPEPVVLPARAAKATGKRIGHVAPLSPRRFKVEITIGEKAHDTLRQLQDLLSHQIPSGDPALVIERALEDLLKKTLKSKTAMTERPRKATPKRSVRRNDKSQTALRPIPRERCPDRNAAMSKRRALGVATSQPNETISSTSKTRTRAIPADVKRTVWQRDGGSCAFTDAKGRRCDQRRFIEYHHDLPYARGGEHLVENIELRCRAHNLLEAEREYGVAFMAAKSGHTKVSEVTHPYSTTSQAHFKGKPYGEQSARPTIYRIDSERISSG